MTAGAFYLWLPGPKQNRHQLDKWEHMPPKMMGIGEFPPLGSLRVEHACFAWHWRGPGPCEPEASQTTQQVGIHQVQNVEGNPSPSWNFGWVPGNPLSPSDLTVGSSGLFLAEPNQASNGFKLLWETVVGIYRRIIIPVLLRCEMNFATIHSTQAWTDFWAGSLELGAKKHGTLEDVLLKLGVFFCLGHPPISSWPFRFPFKPMKQGVPSKTDNPTWTKHMLFHAPPILCLVRHEAHVVQSVQLCDQDQQKASAPKERRKPSISECFQLALG